MGVLISLLTSSEKTLFRKEQKMKKLSNQGSQTSKRSIEFEPS